MTTADLLAPERTVRFDAAAHRYWYGDAELPSVTTVLARVGLLRLGGSEEANEYARDRGNAVHLATELNDRGDLVEESISAEIRPYLNAWRRFVSEMSFEAESIELIVHHDRYSYAGRVDRLGTIRPPGRHEPISVILDIKTGAKQRATGYQLAAYNGCLAVPGKALRRRVGVYLRPDGTYACESYKEPGDFASFLSCLNVYNLLTECGVR